MRATASAWAAASTRTRTGCRASAGAALRVAICFKSEVRRCGRYSLQRRGPLLGRVLRCSAQCSLQVAAQDGGAHGLLPDTGL